MEEGTRDRKRRATESAESLTAEETVEASEQIIIFATEGGSSRSLPQNSVLTNATKLRIVVDGATSDGSVKFSIPQCASNSNVDDAGVGDANSEMETVVEHPIHERHNDS